MTKLKDIVFSTDHYWVKRVPKGFEIYETGLTHSTRVGIIGHAGEEGLRRAKAEIARREAKKGSAGVAPSKQKQTATGPSKRETAFVDYLISFYGPEGIYTTARDPFHKPMTRDEAKRVAIVMAAKKDFEGDTIDREKARDLVLEWRLQDKS